MYAGRAGPARRPRKAGFPPLRREANSSRCRRPAPSVPGAAGAWPAAAAAGSADERGLADLADLVAHPRRFLELEVAGVLVHLLLQRLEPGRQPGRIERGVVFGLLGRPARLAGRRPR